MLWLLPFAWADVCLLSLKSETAKNLAQDSHVQLAESFKAWARQHQRLHRNFLNSEADFNEFIAGQKASSDACYAQLFEARRTTDGLHAKVLAIAEAIKAIEAIVAAHTNIIEEKNDEKARGEEAMNIALAGCERDKVKEWAEKVSTLDKELAELIGYSTVSGTGSFDPDWPDAALVQTAWTSAACHRTQALIREHRATAGNATSGQSPVYFELDCDATYDKLKHEYSSSITEIRDMRYSAATVVNGTCDACTTRERNAFEEIKKTTNSAVDAATAEIDKALDRVDSLTPTLADAKHALSLVSTHMEDLRGKCTVDDTVSVHLSHVRDLIESLEQCPGRHDFKLTKPS